MIINIVRKPLIGSVGNNITLHNIGGINIEGCRVGNEDTRSPTSLTALGQNSGWNNHENRVVMAGSSNGRWPANVFISENISFVVDRQSGVSVSSGGRIGNAQGVYANQGRTGWGTGHEKGDGGFGDVGGASRYFKVIKENE